MSDLQQAAPEQFSIQIMQLDLIERDPNQVRKTFDETKLDELGQSIKAQGMVQPIVAVPGKDGKVRIVAGERRMRASLKAGLSTAPVIVRTDLKADDIAVIQLVENLQREGLSLPELGAGCAALVEQIGLDAAASRLGQSKPWVSRHAGVLDLDIEVRSLIERGRVTAIDIAHDIDKLKEYGGGRFKETVMEFDQKNSWIKPPTREQLRERVKSAKEIFDQREAKKAADKAERQKIKDDPKYAAKVATQKEKDKANGVGKAQSDRNRRALRCNELKEQGEQLAAAWTQTLLAFFGKDFSKVKHADQLPASVDHFTYRNEYQNDILPESAIKDQFLVRINGPIDQILAPLNAVAPGAKVGAELELTQAEARSVEKALGRPVEWEFRERLSGKKLDVALTSKKPKPASTSTRDTSVNDFLRDCTRLNPERRTKAADFHAAYVTYCETKNIADPLALNDTRFGDCIKAAGIAKKRLGKGWHYEGLALKAISK